MKKKPTPELIPEKLHLQHIQIYHSNVIAKDEFMQSPCEINDINFNLTNNFSFNMKEGLCRDRLFIHLEAVDSGVPIGFEAGFGIDYHFKIDNFDSFLVKDEKGRTKIHAILASSLFAIAYSTTRGIVFTRTLGTYLNGFMIPVIDPAIAIRSENMTQLVEA